MKEATTTPVKDREASSVTPTKSRNSSILKAKSPRPVASSNDTTPTKTMPNKVMFSPASAFQTRSTPNETATAAASLSTPSPWENEKYQLESANHLLSQKNYSLIHEKHCLISSNQTYAAENYRLHCLLQDAVTKLHASQNNCRLLQEQCGYLESLCVASKENATTQTSTEAATPINDEQPDEVEVLGETLSATLNVMDKEEDNDDDNKDNGEEENDLTENQLYGLLSNEEKWLFRYNELVAFKEEHGHFKVGANVPKLQSWVRSQRYQHKRLSLSQERMERLNEIGFFEPSLMKKN